MVGNEALVDNWKAVALVVGDNNFAEKSTDIPSEFSNLDLPIKRPSEIS